MDRVLEEKIGLSAIGEIVDKIIVQAIKRELFSNRAENKLLALTKFPTLCVSMLEHYEVKNFSELCETPFYKSLELSFKTAPDFLEKFKTQFEQTVTQARQNRRPQT